VFGRKLGGIARAKNDYITCASCIAIQPSKLVLSPFDDKRYLIPESKAERLPWGHYQSSKPENVTDLVDINGNPVNAPVVNHVPIVNGEMPTANNDLDVSTVL